MLTMKLSAVVLLSLVNLCVAPFPEDHPYHWANPLIEPWWVKLGPQQQKKVYEQWQKIEPFMKAVAFWSGPSKKSKRSVLLGHDDSQLDNSLFGHDDSQLDNTLFGHGDWQLGNSLFGHDDSQLSNSLFKQDDSMSKAMEGGKTRRKSDSQGKWEDFQASSQLASLQASKAKRAKYQALLEVAKLVKNKKNDLFFSDDESWFQRFQDNLKIESLQLRDRVQDFLNSRSEGLNDSTEELWKQIQKNEAKIRDFLSNTKEEIRKRLWLNNVINKRK